MKTAEDVKRRLFRNEKVSDLFSVIDYVPHGESETSNYGYFLFDDKTIGVFLIMQPTTGSNANTSNALNNFYKETYPNDTLIQWSLASLPDLENEMAGYDDIRGDRVSHIEDSPKHDNESDYEYRQRLLAETQEDTEKIEAMSNANRDFVREGALNDINCNGYRFRTYECWATIRIPYKGHLPPENLINGFMKQTRRLMSTLSPFQPRMANQADLERRMNVLLCMYGDRPTWKKGPSFKARVPNGFEVRQNFVDPGWSIEQQDGGVQIYDSNAKPTQYVKMMSIRDYPDQMTYGSVIHLVGQWLSGAVILNEHYVLTLNIQYPDQKKVKKFFDRKRALINNQAQGEILKWLEKLRDQREDYARVAREMTNEGSKLIYYSMNMAAFCQNEQHAEDFYQKISGFYEKSNFKLVADSIFTLPFMLACLPFGLDQTFRKVSFRFSNATTKALRFLTPHIAGWKGNTNRPVLMLGDRFGQTVCLDFFKTSTNFNIYCAATSGSGKSFFVSTLVNAMLGSGIEFNSSSPTGSKPEYYDGGQVFMIDCGHSYQKLAAMYNNAQFLEFGKDANYSLNPFPNITDINEVDQNAQIMTLIKTMASPKGIISDDQSSQLMKIVIQCFNEHGTSTQITDISEACKDSEHPFMHQIGRQLEPFSEGGHYADFFNNKYPPVSFDTRLVVCELEQVKANKHLQITVLMALVMGIQHKIFISSQKDKRRRMFVLDEAWEFLKDESKNPMLKFFAEFIEAGWRRFRKYGASGCLATQSVNDATSSQVGEAVLGNSEWKLLLGQQGTEISKLQKNNTIGDEQIVRLLETVHTRPPDPKITDEAYSECLILNSQVAHVCRLYTPRNIQLVNTTKKEEKDLIRSYMQKGFSLEEAIKDIVRSEQASKNY